MGDTLESELQCQSAQEISHESLSIDEIVPEQLANTAQMPNAEFQELLENFEKQKDELTELKEKMNIVQDKADQNDKEAAKFKMEKDKIQSDWTKATETWEKDLE